jgi:hypothetical protein
MMAIGLSFPSCGDNNKKPSFLWRQQQKSCQEPRQAMSRLDAARKGRGSLLWGGSGSLTRLRPLAVLVLLKRSDLREF